MTELFAGAQRIPETFAHGLRDPEGAAINPATGELWVTDHGPQGGDEINIIRAGRNYGWPDVSYGTQYDFQRTDGRENVPVGPPDLHSIFVKSVKTNGNFIV